MADYAFFDKRTSRYVLGPPVIPAQENYPAAETWNPTFELSYWSYGLKVAQTWRERLGLGGNVGLGLPDDGDDCRTARGNAHRRWCFADAHGKESLPGKRAQLAATKPALLSPRQRWSALRDCIDGRWLERRPQTKRSGLSFRWNLVGEVGRSQIGGLGFHARAAVRGTHYHPQSLVEGLACAMSKKRCSYCLA